MFDKSQLEAEDFNQALRYLIQAGLFKQLTGSADGKVEITLPGKILVENLDKAAAGDPRSSGETTGVTMGSLAIFISHSSRDEALARSLIELLRAAMNLSSDAIRCTSVNGYRLPVGASTEEQLRREVHESRAFIALVTPSSVESTYVLFELGARWGAGLPLAPVLGGGARPSILGGPLKGLNALCCDDPSQVHQLIRDVASTLGITPDVASAYQGALDALIAQSHQAAQEQPASGAVAVPAAQELDEADIISEIKSYLLQAEASSSSKRHVPFLVRYAEVDAACNFVPGTAQEYAAKAAKRFKYSILEQGANTIMLQDPPPPVPHSVSMRTF